MPSRLTRPGGFVVLGPCETERASQQDPPQKSQARLCANPRAEFFETDGVNEEER